MSNMPFEMWLQSRLTAHGFACGVIDGILGPKTLHALRSFQKARGLPVTSQADEATVMALRASSSRVSDEVSSSRIAAMIHLFCEGRVETVEKSRRRGTPQNVGQRVVTAEFTRQ